MIGVCVNILREILPGVRLQAGQALVLGKENDKVLMSIGEEACGQAGLLPGVMALF